MKWHERPSETHSYDWTQPVPKHLATEEKRPIVSFANAAIWKKCEKCGKDCLGEDGLMEHEAGH